MAAASVCNRGWPSRIRYRVQFVHAHSFRGGRQIGHPGGDTSPSDPSRKASGSQAPARRIRGVGSQRAGARAVREGEQEVTKRRGQGERSIRERSNGRWEARYRPPTAIAQHLRCDPPRGSGTAQDGPRSNGHPTAGYPAHRGGFLEDWLQAKEQRIRPRTHQSYAAAVPLYIAPAIGGIPIARLQPEHVARMVAGLTKRGTALSRR
jgi:hypothetical protein